MQIACTQYTVEQFCPALSIAIEVIPLKRIFPGAVLFPCYARPTLIFVYLTHFMAVGFNWELA